MARGYLQRHLFPYFSRFLPLNTAARRIEVDLKRRSCASVHSVVARGKSSDVCIILICWEFNIMPLSAKVFKINRILGDCG